MCTEKLDHYLHTTKSVGCIYDIEKKANLLYMTEIYDLVWAIKGANTLNQNTTLNYDHILSWPILKVEHEYGRGKVPRCHINYSTKWMSHRLLS